MSSLCCNGTEELPEFLATSKLLLGKLTLCKVEQNLSNENLLSYATGAVSHHCEVCIFLLHRTPTDYKGIFLVGQHQNRTSSLAAMIKLEFCTKKRNWLSKVLRQALCAKFSCSTIIHTSASKNLI